MHAYTHTHRQETWHACAICSYGGHRTVSRTWLSLFTVWVPGIKLRSLSLATESSHQALFLTYLLMWCGPAVACVYKSEDSSTVPVLVTT